VSVYDNKSTDDKDRQYLDVAPEDEILLDSCDVSAETFPRIDIKKVM